MLVLSFRDMTTARCSAVTAASFFELSQVDPEFDWKGPPPLRSVTWLQAGARLAGKHVGFLVHGFNVNRDFGYTGFGAVSQEMTYGEGALPVAGFPRARANLAVAGIDLLVPVLWAGDWYLPVNYPFLLPDIRRTGAYFADLFLSGAARPARVSFMTHSMGARVVLETVQQTLSGAAARQRPPVFETCLFTAPAVSDEVLDDSNYADAVAAVERFVVVSSRADTVLSGAFPWGNAVEQALWPRDPGADDALGRYGPRLKPGSAALGKTEWYEIPLNVGQNHGDYVPSPLAPVDVDYPNGWFAKCLDIGKLGQAVLEWETPPYPPAKLVTARG
jgi:hypothetical protein